MWPELLFIVVLLPIGHQVYGRKIYAHFNALDCSHYDTDYVETMKCWLEPDRKGQLMLSTVLKLKQDLTNIICKFHFIVELNKKNRTFISMDFDICSALGTAFKNPVLRLVSEEIRRTSNLPLECPLTKGIEYGLYNFTIITKYIPPFTPQIKWMSHSEFHTNSTEEKLLRFVATGRVVHFKPNTA